MMNTKTIADSIAIKILSKNALLTGVGNELHLHTTNGHDVLPMRLRGKVHGIELGKALNANKVIVYGEKEFMILDWSGKNQFEVFYRGKLTDWISAATFLHDNREFVLLTAHSILLRFEYFEKSANCTEKCKIVERCSCTDKSTLYCSHLYGQVWEELVVFGGNAFGELLIWQPTQLVNGQKKAILLQRLQMHNGVIFSINYNEQSKLLTTTSDDRSIRFWEVNQTNQDWAETKVTLAASGYGHVARVFQGKLINHGNDLLAISVGEDSYFCIWRSTGELLYKRRHQFGATIWNFDYEEETNTLFTIGSTGNLLAFGLNDVLENRGNEVALMPQVDWNNSAEYVAKVKFLAKDLLIGVTNQNRFIYKILSVPEEEKENATWQSVQDFSAYKCTVLEVQNNLIALGGYKRLTLFKYTSESSFVKLFDGEVLSGVIRSFKFLNDSSYLVSDELGNCLLMKGEDMLKRYNIELPKCKERWLTTALLIEDELLIVSNRLGNLMLYKFTESLEKYELKDTLKHPHGNLGATVLQLVESSKHSAFVRSAGHDGSLRLLCIDKQLGTLRTYSREVVPVTWVEHAIPMDASQLLLGFNDNHFVAWSRMLDFSFQVPCGGGHRCWHFVIFEDDSSHTKWLQLAFIQHKRVSMHRLKLFNEVQTKIQLPSRNMWHVRPCNALSLVENKSNENILISAGDDNLIKISMHHKKSGSLTQKAELHTHISNIRALRVFKLNSDYCLILSGGGRAQLCLTKVNLNTYQVEELLNYTLKSESNGNQRSFSFDPETRIMTIDLVALNNSTEFAIYLGCSDGFVRKLFLNSEMEISLDKEVFYGKCVLQVRCVSEQYVVVAATDGVLRFYDLQLNETLLELAHHSSGINALDVLTEEESDLKILHVLSGGDDQAVTYTKLSVDTLDSPPRIVKRLSLKNHHTAQVTAVCLSGRYAFTSGIDQNILKYNLESEAVEEVLHSCVADVKGLCLDSNHGCFLYGCGLQIHNFSI